LNRKQVSFIALVRVDTYKVQPVDGLHKFTMKLVFVSQVSLFTIFTNKFIVELGVRLRLTCTVHPHCALATLNPVHNILVTVVIFHKANCTVLGIQAF